MRVELDLPEWANRSNLYILSETEPVAYKLKDGPWMIKVDRCRMDGQCCMHHVDKFPLPLDNGRCIYLKKEVGQNDRWRCGLGLFRPLQCCIGNGGEECSVTYKEQ